jgi:RimJ/RimL family protein N-acetyltransferase
MGNRHWPLDDLRIRTPDLLLRPVTEADLGALADLLPEDVEQDPAAYTFEGLPAAANRGVVVHQEYWRARGGWRAESWALGLGVFAGGRLIGQQGLEGDDFAVLRTVDSFSFLAPDARGRGWGVQMRAGALALAFGALAARTAVTSAWHDNAASLGVSRSLGYADNGTFVHRRGDGVDEMVHLRLDRATWLASTWPDRVQVSGVGPCLPFFGLT